VEESKDFVTMLVSKNVTMGGGEEDVKNCPKLRDVIYERPQKIFDIYQATHLIVPFPHFFPSDQSPSYSSLPISSSALYIWAKIQKTS
jgi:hypothetical protein